MELEGVGAKRGDTLTVVTASDHQYFRHLQNLINSLNSQDTRPGRLVIVDVGLTKTERDFLLGAKCDIIEYPGSLFGDVRAELAALEVRPCLDQLLPEAQHILWLDADIWLQSPSYITELCEYIQDYELLVSLQIDVGYDGGRPAIKVKSGMLGTPHISGWNFDLLAECYGRAVAFPLVSRATVNGGFFLAHRDSVFWEEWRRRYRQTKHRKTGTDQIALTRTYVEVPLRAAALDASFNWCCSFVAPIFDQTSNFFRKPNPPYDIIRGLHLNGHAKTEQFNIRRFRGTQTKISFADPHVVAAALASCREYTRRRGLFVGPTTDLQSSDRS